MFYCLGHESNQFVAVGVCQFLQFVLLPKRNNQTLIICIGCEKLHGHPAETVLGWVARDECPVPNLYTYQAIQSGFRESFSCLSIVLQKRGKFEVSPTLCSMLRVVKDTTLGVKVQPVCGLSPLVTTGTDHKNSTTASLVERVPHTANNITKFFVNNIKREAK